MPNIAMDPVYAKKLGVDIDEMLISQPDTGEQALEITDTLVRSGGVDIIVIDSVAALILQGRVGRRNGRFPAGLQARLMQARRTAQARQAPSLKSNTIVIFIKTRSA